MRQLPLDVQLADYALFDTFYAGQNAAVVHALRECLAGNREGGNKLIWLWGTPESGKSHLLQAMVAAADEAGLRPVWLPLKEPGFEPEMLDGMEAFDLVCIDDIDSVAGNRDWEIALFNLFERLMQRNVRLVVTAETGANAAGFVLRDLNTRMNWGTTFRVQTLNDEESLAALQKRAHHRGLNLPVDTANYLLTRVNRSPATLFNLLDRLDKEALAAQRKLTVPFVRSVLESS